MKIIKGEWNEKSEELTQEVINQPFAFINSNGSKWAGENPDDIEKLLECLHEHTLDPDFEKYGNFITANPCRAAHNPKWTGFDNKEPQWIDGDRLFETEGVVQFWGNFFDVSHCFCIYTNDKDTIYLLTDAIRHNQSLHDYLIAKCQRAI
jgi:hypothetical protein